MWHTDANHQGLRLKVRKLNKFFSFEGCWCEKCYFVASYNDDGECEEHCNGKECHIFPHDGESKFQCNEPECCICL